jgi:hypothetical protein
MKDEVPGKQPVPVPFRFPQVLLGLAPDRSQASAVSARQTNRLGQGTALWESVSTFCLICVLEEEMSLVEHIVEVWRIKWQMPTWKRDLTKILYSVVSVLPSHLHGNVRVTKLPSGLRDVVGTLTESNWVVWRRTQVCAFPPYLSPSRVKYGFPGRVNSGSVLQFSSVNCTESYGAHPQLKMCIKNLVVFCKLPWEY